MFLFFGCNNQELEQKIEPTLEKENSLEEVAETVTSCEDGFYFDEQAQKCLRLEEEAVNEDLTCDEVEYTWSVDDQKCILIEELEKIKKK